MGAITVRVQRNPAAGKQLKTGDGWVGWHMRAKPMQNAALPAHVGLPHLCPTRLVQ